MKLYYSPGACSMSPHIVLEELGIPHTLEKVDLRSKKTETGADFNQINPKGYVPALALDSGEVLTEGPAIVQYLADSRPEAGLTPAGGTVARAQLQGWLNFISTELHKSFSPLFNPAAAEEWKAGARALLLRRLEVVATHLASSDYLMGNSFSVADAYLFTVLSWTRHVHIDLTPWPALLAYLKRVGARPSVQAALRAEGLLA